MRYPCAMVPPKGPAAARSGSTWIHWWSPVASREGVDLGLGDLVPRAGAELLADGVAEGLQGREDAGCHGPDATALSRAVVTGPTASASA